VFLARSRRPAASLANLLLLVGTWGPPWQSGASGGATDSSVGVRLKRCQ